MRSTLSALLIVVFTATFVMAQVGPVWADDNTTTEANREFNGRKDQDAFDLDWRLQLTEARTENSNLRQTQTINANTQFWGGVVIVSVVLIGLLIIGVVRRVGGQMLDRYDQHINPNNEVNRQASMGAIQAQTMAAWRETFQTFERGTGSIAGIDPSNRMPNT